MNAPAPGHHTFVRVLDRVDAWQQRHRVPAFVVGVLKKYGDDRGGQLAALIAYYGFLAMFPLLLVFVTVLGYVAHGDPGLRRDLLDTALADLWSARNCGATSARSAATVLLSSSAC